MNRFILAAFAVVLYASLAQAGFANCPIKMEPIGCYKDLPSDRAMPMEISNGKDVYSPTYSGTLVSWGNYQPWLEDFMCSCAQKAFQKGYRVIGIQYYAECWASQNGHNDFDRHGAVNTCRDGKYAPCAPGSKICAGEMNTNYVYRIAPTDCNTYYEPQGCFKDTGALPRPLPTYAMNERDYSIANWNGRLIDWKTWNTYSPAMICRCAEEARRRMHDYFAIQFYGECWSGKAYQSNYKRDGLVDRCIAKDFDTPNYNSYIAVGKDRVNYVYKLKPGPIV